MVPKLGQITSLYFAMPSSNSELAEWVPGTAGISLSWTDLQAQGKLACFGGAQRHPQLCFVWGGTRLSCCHAKKIFKWTDYFLRRKQCELLIFTAQFPHSVWGRRCKSLPTKRAGSGISFFSGMHIISHPLLFNSQVKLRFEWEVIWEPFQSLLDWYRTHLGCNSRHTYTEVHPIKCNRT